MFRNLSGHYTPQKEHLDPVIHWFENNIDKKEGNITINDTANYDPDWKLEIRSLSISLPKEVNVDPN